MRAALDVTWNGDGPIIRCNYGGQVRQADLKTLLPSMELNDEVKCGFNS